MSVNRTWLRTLMLSMALLAQAAHAKPEVTPQELKAMEPACQAIGMGEINGVFWGEVLNKPENKHILDQTENAMAKDAGWFHHYCWGKLGKLKFFSAKTPNERAFQIKRWRNNMEFIVNWTTQHQIDWPYIHLIHKEIAESYLYEKNYLKAISEAEHALKTNREFAGAYILIADAYAEMKNRSKALEYVTDGLKYSPDSKALKRRYKALGGVMPFPQPILKALAHEETAQAAPTPPKIAPSSTATEPPAQPAQSSTQAPEAKPEEKPAGNPYCRFCP